MKHYHIPLITLFSLLFLFSITPNAHAQLRASCSVFPSTNVVPGETVTWRATGVGGEQTYDYIWTGTEGLSGSERDAEIIYRTTGLKGAQVTIISGNEQATAQCPRVNLTYPPLRGGCYVATKASKGDVTSTYRTELVGGNGVYSFQWSGTDGLSGTDPQVSHSYTTSGFKVATVTVSSGGQSRQFTCNVDIPEVNRLPDPPVIFGCEADMRNFITFEEFEWNTIYSTSQKHRDRRDIERDTSFRWEGTDDISIFTKDLEHDYNDRGYKTIKHSVYDEDLRFRASSQCQMYIVDDQEIPDRDIRRLERQWRQSSDFNDRTQQRSSRSSGTREGVAISYPGTQFDACFIATASYGSKWNPHVETLREFRDEYLETNTFGRFLIQVYYKVSPGYAYILEQSDLLRMHMRTALTPLSSLIAELIEN